MIDAETLINDKQLLLEENKMLRQMLQIILKENAQLQHELETVELMLYLK